MASCNYMLLNPSFLNDNNEYFGLICDENNINKCIKYFWSEITKKIFKNEYDSNVNNFPLQIFDKTSLTMRYFILKQEYLSNTKIKISYKERLNEIISSDKYMNKSTFSYYVYSLTNDFTTKLYIYDKNDILLPKIKQKMIFKIV